MPKRPGPALACLAAAWLLAAAAPEPLAAARDLDPAGLQAARAEERRLTDALVAAAARLRKTEVALSAASQRVAELTQRQRSARQHLAERRAALAPLLPLAERLALYPAETLLAVPAPPERAIRGLALLHGLMRKVEAQARALQDELAAVEADQRTLDAAIAQLHSVEAEQTTQSAAIDRQLAEARAARAGIEDAAADAIRREAAEATRAETVGAALDSMAAARARTHVLLQQDADRAERQRREGALAIARERQAEVAAPAGPGISVGGAAVIPVTGPVVRHWGDATDTGPAHGIAFRAPPKALVVAPCAGRVAFAAPFRSYGVLVIIDCGGGYHFVLAGLDTLAAEAGERVRPGQPVGAMPDWRPSDASADAGKRPVLYVELRNDGRPIDPAPFLRPAS